MLPGYDDTLGYLAARYLTLQGLAEASGLPAARLLDLIDGGCLPAHSHAAVLSLRVDTIINGSHPTAEKLIRFYHPDLADLARETDALARAQGLEAASATIRARHDAAVARAAGLEPGAPAHRELADAAWVAWRDGTFGVCLKHVSTPDMIQKVLATNRMKAALEQAQHEGPAAVDVRGLVGALERYAAVTGPFGPQERDGSTRALVYEPALALWRSLADGAAA
jgi:hypothetical protein